MVDQSEKNLFCIYKRVVVGTKNFFFADFKHRRVLRGSRLFSFKWSQKRVEFRSLSYIFVSLQAVLYFVTIAPGQGHFTAVLEQPVFFAKNQQA